MAGGRRSVVWKKRLGIPRNFTVPENTRNYCHVFCGPTTRRHHYPAEHPRFRGGDITKLEPTLTKVFGKFFLFIFSARANFYSSCTENRKVRVRTRRRLVYIRARWKNNRSHVYEHSFSYRRKTAILKIILFNYYIKNYFARLPSYNIILITYVQCRGLLHTLSVFRDMFSSLLYSYRYNFKYIYIYIHYYEACFISKHMHVNYF